MVDYREILRLHSLNYSFTQIASAIHSSRNTVREVIRLADKQDIHWPLDDTLTNVKLRDLFYPERSLRAKVCMDPDCEWIHSEIEVFSVPIV